MLCSGIEIISTEHTFFFESLSCSIFVGWRNGSVSYEPVNNILKFRSDRAPIVHKCLIWFGHLVGILRILATHLHKCIYGNLVCLRILLALIQTY